MAKARPFEQTAEAMDLRAPVGFSDMCLFALPVETFKALSDEAARRGITFSQLMERAFKAVLADSGAQPKLLTEKG